MSSFVRKPNGLVCKPNGLVCKPNGLELLYQKYLIFRLTEELNQDTISYITMLAITPYNKSVTTFTQLINYIGFDCGKLSLNKLHAFCTIVDDYGAKLAKLVLRQQHCLLAIHSFRFMKFETGTLFHGLAFIEADLRYYEVLCTIIPKSVGRKNVFGTIVVDILRKQGNETVLNYLLEVTGSEQ